MFDTECTDHLHLAIKADSLGGDLMNQLADFYNAYPDTGLVIIDTLQRIREIDGERYSYASDYEALFYLK